MGNAQWKRGSTTLSATCNATNILDCVGLTGWVAWEVWRTPSSLDRQ
ncbi:MAG: hypothetical protein R8K48_04885 [Gallionella sp.]